jgi:hypothetical protein
MKELGHTFWVIPDMYMKSDAQSGKVPSHESVSIFNSGEVTALVTVTLVYGTTGDSRELSPFDVSPFQSMQLRMDKLEKWGVEVPRNSPYSAIIKSSRKVVVEYARLNWIDGLYQSFGLIPYGED